jgi:hypothetical protein
MRVTIDSRPFCRLKSDILSPDEMFVYKALRTPKLTQLTIQCKEITQELLTSNFPSNLLHDFLRYDTFYTYSEGISQIFTVCLKKHATFCCL